MISEVAGRRATGRGFGTFFVTPFPGNVTSGNLLIVAGTLGRINDPPGNHVQDATLIVNDTRGTTYTVIRGTFPEIGGDRQPFIAYGLAPSSGANTVQISCGGAPCSISYAIDEFTGLHATVPFHNSATAMGISLSPVASMFSNVQNVMFIGVMTHISPSTPLTPTIAYTEIGEWETNEQPPDVASNVVFRVVTSTGSYFVSWSTAFIQWNVLIAAFKPPDPVVSERTAVGKSASLLWKIRNTVGASSMLLWDVEVIEWPDIPVPLRSHRRAIDPQNLTTEMETSRLRKRRQFEDPREIWDVSWHFTEDQFEIFKEFFDVTIKNGTVRFHIELFGVDRIVEFFEVYTLNHTDNLFAVEAALLVHPIESS